MHMAKVPRSSDIAATILTPELSPYAIVAACSNPPQDAEPSFRTTGTTCPRLQPWRRGHAPARGPDSPPHQGCVSAGRWLVVPAVRTGVTVSRNRGPRRAGACRHDPVWVIPRAGRVRWVPHPAALSTPAPDTGPRPGR